MESERAALASYTIMDLKMPSVTNLDSDLEWICRCLGFLEPRDKDRTAAKIFRSLLEAMKAGKGRTSDELAAEIGLTRGAVVHHLNKLIQSGLVIRREGQYELRGRSLQRTIREIKRDIDRIFENVEQVAQSIDKSLELVYR
ncbi:MAG: ArsR family transcriptional regulator [Candidatus Bathyarchaeia archaeon]